MKLFISAPDAGLCVNQPPTRTVTVPSITQLITQLVTQLITQLITLLTLVSRYHLSESFCNGLKQERINVNR